jgi:hypothetical protein
MAVPETESDVEMIEGDPATAAAGPADVLRDEGVNAE